MGMAISSLECITSLPLILTVRPPRLGGLPGGVLGATTYTGKRARKMGRKYQCRNGEHPRTRERDLP